MTGLPPPPPRPGSPQSSLLRVTKPGKCSEMPLSGSPGSRLHAKPTRTALPKNVWWLGAALAASASCSRSGSRPLPGGAQTLRARRGLGGAGFPPHPPRGAGSPQSLVAATAPLWFGPPAAPPLGMGGGLKTRDGRGASRSQVVPGVPRGWTEGTRCLGLCTRSTDRASCSRAAADHAWPLQPIG